MEKTKYGLNEMLAIITKDIEEERIFLQSYMGTESEVKASNRVRELFSYMQKVETAKLHYIEAVEALNVAKAGSNEYLKKVAKSNVLAEQAIFRTFLFETMEDIKRSRLHESELSCKQIVVRETAPVKVVETTENAKTKSLSEKAKTFMYGVIGAALIISSIAFAKNISKSASNTPSISITDPKTDALNIAIDEANKAIDKMIKPANGYTSYIDAELLEKINDVIKNLRIAIANKNYEDIKRLTSELNGYTRIVEKIVEEVKKAEAEEKICVDEGKRLYQAIKSNESKSHATSYTEDEAIEFVKILRGHYGNEKADAYISFNTEFYADILNSFAMAAMDGQKINYIDTYKCLKNADGTYKNGAEAIKLFEKAHIDILNSQYNKDLIKDHTTFATDYITTGANKGTFNGEEYSLKEYNMLNGAEQEIVLALATTTASFDKFIVKSKEGNWLFWRLIYCNTGSNEVEGLGKNPFANELAQSGAVSYPEKAYKDFESDILKTQGYTDEQIKQLTLCPEKQR